MKETCEAHLERAVLAGGDEEVAGGVEVDGLDGTRVGHVVLHQRPRAHVEHLGTSGRVSDVGASPPLQSSKADQGTLPVARLASW